MAKPVSVIPTQPGAREELIAKLNEAPAQHAAALLDIYELVEMLHKRGMIDLLRGMVGAGDEIVGRLAEAMDQPETMQALRDFIELTKMFARINPEGLCNSIEQGAELLNDPALTMREPPGLWSIFRRMGSPDARRALAMAAEVLNTVGRKLDRRPPAVREVKATRRLREVRSA